MDVDFPDPPFGNAVGKLYLHPISILLLLHDRYNLAPVHCIDPFKGPLPVGRLVSQAGGYQGYSFFLAAEKK